LREDKVIADMLEKLNCKVSYFQDCFTPLSGAYGVGRTFTHAH
jgi:urease accessory protein UreE